MGFFFVQCSWCLSSFLSVAYRVWQYEHTNTPTKLCSLHKWSAKPASAPVHLSSQCLQKMWGSVFFLACKCEMFVPVMNPCKSLETSWASQF